MLCVKCWPEETIAIFNLNGRSLCKKCYLNSTRRIGGEFETVGEPVPPLNRLIKEGSFKEPLDVEHKDYPEFPFMPGFEKRWLQKKRRFWF